MKNQKQCPILQLLVYNKGHETAHTAPYNEFNFRRKVVKALILIDLNVHTPDGLNRLDQPLRLEPVLLVLL